MTSSPSPRRGPVLPSTSADAAIPELLETFGPRIHAVAYRITGDPSDAEDVAQETFLQAYRKWDQFRGEANPGTWLYTIAIRAARRVLKRRIRRRQLVRASSEILPFHDERLPPPPVELGTGEQETIRAETIGEVDRAIAGLPVHYRLPLVLKDIAELSVEQVASVLGIKPATVKTRTHRARLLLRAALTEDAPTVRMPPPAYERRMCLDLLRAKMEALDRDVPFPVQDDLVCERCKSVFAWLDLARDSCRHLATGAMPPRLRELVRQDMADGRRATGAAPRDARRPRGRAGRDRPATDKRPRS